MKIDNMNKDYLDKVLGGLTVDYLYHLGIASTDEAYLKLIKDVKAVVMAGSAHRVQRMAETWSEQHKNSHLIKFPKDERFSMFYSDGVLFCSHGMGMPSMSIALQELMKLIYYVKGGLLKEVEKVMWFRVGTSGGMVDPGTVVLTTEGLCADLKPYRLLVLGKEYYFSSAFPDATINEIISANKGEKDLNIVKGKTVGGDSFYLEQNRIDGAIALCNEKEKMEWIKQAQEYGVKNIEMESPVMAAFLNYWGFKDFAVICCVLVNRLKGDQIRSTKEELEQYSLNAEKVLWNYLNWRA